MSNATITTVPDHSKPALRFQGSPFSVQRVGLATLITFAISLAGCQSAQLQQAFNSKSSEKLAEKNKKSDLKAIVEDQKIETSTKEKNKKEALVGLIGGSKISKTDESPTDESPKVQRQLKEDMAQGLRAASEARYDAAQTHFTRVLQADPDNIEAHHHLAMVADQLRDFESAEFHYRQALSSNPKDPKLLSDVGWSLILQKRYQESEQYLQEALKFDPRNKMALSRMGYLYSQLNEYDKAYAMFRMSGTEQEAQANMAELFPQGRPLTTQSLAQNAARMNPQQAWAGQQGNPAQPANYQAGNIQNVQHTQNTMPPVSPHQSGIATDNPSPFYGQNQAANTSHLNVPTQQLSAPTPWENQSAQLAQQQGSAARQTTSPTWPNQQFDPPQSSQYQANPYQANPYQAGQQNFTGETGPQQMQSANPMQPAQSVAAHQQVGQALGGYEPPPFNTMQQEMTPAVPASTQMSQSNVPVINPGFSQQQSADILAGNQANPLDTMPAWPFAKNSAAPDPVQNNDQNIPNWPGHAAADSQGQNPHGQYNLANNQQPAPTGIQRTGYSQTPPNWPAHQNPLPAANGSPAGQNNSVMHAHGYQNQNGAAATYQQAQTQAAYRGMNIGPGQMFPVVNALGQQSNGIPQTGAVAFQNQQSQPTITPGQSTTQNRWPQTSNSQQPADSFNQSHASNPPNANWNQFPNAQSGSDGSAGQSMRRHPQQGYAPQHASQQSVPASNAYGNYPVNGGGQFGQ